jgi:hypothetical protein
MVRTTPNPETVPIKRVAHAAITITFQALHNDVRRITRCAEFSQSQPRRLARNAAVMNVLHPRKIREVSLATGQQKTHWQSRRWVASSSPAALMNIPSSIWAPLILNQSENAGFDGGERVTERTTKPPRKRRDRDAHGGSSRISMIVIEGNRGQVQLLHLRPELSLDRCQQAVFCNLRAVARIPIIQAKNEC